MKVSLLDHGYLELIETWGSDERIIESARMSTGKGFLGWGPFCSKCGISMVHGFGDGVSPADYERGEQRGCDHDANKPGDEKLLRFLWKNEHATPFEMAGATFEVKAPIMVFREWHRHRVPFGYNELSARYTPLPNENYVPDAQDLVERSLAAAQTRNRQAAGTGAVLDDYAAKNWLVLLEQVYDQAQRVYELGLQWGVPKELARLPVPVGRYSRMRATGNLRGWLAFLKLRAAPRAQKEIRVYAEGVQQMLSEKFPRTMEVVG
jgi:thymidylate synthase (FAD)